MMATMKKIEAVTIFGSESNLARALNISQQAVNKWPDTVPPLRVYQIREILQRREAEKASA